MRELTATIDFETRSACSIKTAGSWRYSLHPTTEVLCLCFRLPYWEPGEVDLWTPFDRWCPASLRVFDLFDWIADGGLVEAHNAFFERGIWTNIMVTRYGWSPVPALSWRCSAAKAAAAALPRNLADAGAALRLSAQKDDDGAKLMHRLCKPRKPRKAEIAAGMAPDALVYHESREEFERLFEYCKQDVLAEEALSDALPDLSEQETAVYLLDQETNERGVMLDVEGVQIARQVLAEEQERLNGELATITGGAVPKGTNRAKLVAWCESKGVNLPDTTGDTVDAVLDGSIQLLGAAEIPDDVRRALTILRQMGKSSTAKYETMAAQVCPDQRVHGCLLYHGASTGRWSGSGIQPQNFPKGSLKEWDMDFEWEILKTGDAEFIRRIYGGVMEPLSQALRGALIAPPGKVFYVADYAAIEARVLLWLAEDDDALEIFRRGEDIYCDAASDFYKRDITKKDKEERQLFKIAVLGLGYQMGASRFVDTCAAYGIVIGEDAARDIVTAYREKFWRVRQMWYDQEEAAIRAVRRPYQQVDCGRVSWVSEEGFLYCRLPSGRRLAYPEPEVRLNKTSWGEMKLQLTFMGVNAMTRKWQRQSTYGGMIVENQTQAVSRDIMAEAFLRCGASEYFVPVLTVHDEIIAEGPPNATAEEFEGLVEALPEWAIGLPLKSESWVGRRYHK